MSVYGFDNALNKKEAAEGSDVTTLAGRVTAIETYDSGSHGFSSSESQSVSFADGAELYRRGSLVSIAWTFNTTANIAAYTTICSIPNKFRPLQRQYFVDSAGKRFMITVTGYLQNVDALESGKQHIIGTSYMGKDL